MADVEAQEVESLDDGSQEEVDTEVVETQEEQQQAGQPDYAKQIKGLETALSETRKEWQKAQRELDYVRGVVDQRGHQTQSPAQPKPLFENDSEFWEDIPSTLNKVYQRALEDGVKIATDRMTNDRINRQALEMAQEHSDYPEAQEDFIRAIEFNPALKAAVAQTSNPARAIYQWHQQQKAGANGDVTALQARIAELEKQLNPEPEKPPPKTQAGKRQAGRSASSSDPGIEFPLDR